MQGWFPLVIVISKLNCRKCAVIMSVTFVPGRSGLIIIGHPAAAAFYPLLVRLVWGHKMRSSSVSYHILNLYFFLPAKRSYTRIFRCSMLYVELLGFFSSQIIPLVK